MDTSDYLIFLCSKRISMEDWTAEEEEWKFKSWVKFIFLLKLKAHKMGRNEQSVLAVKVLRILKISFAREYRNINCSSRSVRQKQNGGLNLNAEGRVDDRQAECDRNDHLAKEQCKIEGRKAMPICLTERLQSCHAYNCNKSDSQTPPDRSFLGSQSFVFADCFQSSYF